MDLNLKEIAFDVSTGVVARTAIPNCRQLYMKGKALVLMDPIKDGWNLTAKVEEGKVASICALMREHFERYLEDPGAYLQSMRTGWPPCPVWPTIDDSRMAEEAGSRAAASAASTPHRRHQPHRCRSTTAATSSRCLQRQPLRLVQLPPAQLSSTSHHLLRLVQLPPRPCLLTVGSTSNFCGRRHWSATKACSGSR